MADKPLPWFRAYPEAALDPKFDIIALRTGLNYMIVFGAWWKLLCLAGNSPVRGSLYVTLQDRYSNGDVAVMLRCSNTDCDLLLEHFQTMDMIDLDEAGAYHIKNWDKRQFESDSSTERVKKSREKGKTEEIKDQTVTSPLQDRYSNSDVTPSDTDTDTESYSDAETEVIDDDDSPAGGESAVRGSWESTDSLINAFMTASKLSVPASDKHVAWIKTASEWLTMGVGPPDIREAVLILSDPAKPYKIGGPWSLTNTLAGVVRKREATPLADDVDQDRRRRYKETWT